MFKDCDALTTIDLPDNCENIQYGAFSNCSKLKTISLSNELISLGPKAFEACTSLRSITIPSKITNINKDTFSSCSSLININLPDALTTIRYGAFAGCTSLVKITLPDNLTVIENKAFSGCTSLRIIKRATMERIYILLLCDNRVDVQTKLFQMILNQQQLRERIISFCKKRSPIKLGHNTFEGCTQLDDNTIQKLLYPNNSHLI